MAFTYDPNMTSDERRKQQQQAQQSGGGGVVGSGTPGGTVAAPKQPSSSTGGTQSGQFTNLQSYLGANKDKQFGSQVAGKVEGDLDTANREQQGAATEFRGQVGANTVNYDEGLANEARTNAAQVAGDQAKRAGFERMRDAQYGGPRELTDTGEAYTRATSATQNAQKAAQATGSEEGQRALLGQYYGRPTYSRGETSLDQLLVKGDASAQPKFQQAQQRGQELGGQFQNLQTQLAGEAQQAGQTTDATKQRLQNEFLGEGGAYGQFQGTLQQQADAAKQKAEAQKQQIAYQLAQGQTSDTNLLGQNTWNLDMNQYYGVTDPTLAGTATQEQAANYGALSDLLKQQNTVFTDPSQVGTYDPGKAVNFDMNRFKTDQAAVEQQYQNAIANPEFSSTYWQNTPDGGMITGALLNKKMGLDDAIQKAQQSLNDPSVKGNQKRTDAIYSNLQNLLSQQKAIQGQYGANNKLKSTNYSLNNEAGIGVR